MANNLDTNEDILVKVDQNNLIFIDPNSIVVDNKVQTREVHHENLVMYANLEADLIPRTVLAMSGEQNPKLMSVARGTVNFLKKQPGENGSSDYDSTWTETYVPTGVDSNGNSLLESTEMSDSSAQSFGIESISVDIKGANYIPRITINFVDVRGKTLFESPANSPYKAFFHLPWPIFYLTLKGYYGKAIRYRLHLTKFTSKFNESNGNFDITCTFIGSTYAFMTDISLNSLINAPYMYAIESTTEGATNTKNNTKQIVLSKSSRGYQYLTSIYDQYKQKGLIDKNFPVKTLREVITVAKGLDKILEEQIFGHHVSMEIFAAIKEFETTAKDFETAVNNWGDTHLTNDIVVIGTVEHRSNYRKLSGQKKETLDDIKGTTKSTQLEFILENFRRSLKEVKGFADNTLKNDTGSSFKKETLKVDDTIQTVDKYYKKDPNSSVWAVCLESILFDVYTLQKTFAEQRDLLQKKVEELMNTIIMKDDVGIGFKPTIRNIFAVVMANADVYVRIMKEVHSRAFSYGKQRATKIGTLSDESTKEGPIYPWPEIKKVAPDTKQKVVAYPGSRDLTTKLESNNPILWPEVEFIENLYGVSTKILDTNAKDSTANKVSYVFEKNNTEAEIIKPSTFFQLWNVSPYIDKSLSSILYEIWERGRYITLFDSFDNKTLEELANIEFDNLKSMIKEDLDVIGMLITISNETTLKDNIYKFSPFERYPYFKDNLPTTPYIKELMSSQFILEDTNGSKNKNNDDKLKNLSASVKNYKSEDYRKNIYPFNSDLYLSYLNKKSYGIDNLTFTNSLEVKTTEGLISSLKNFDWSKNNTSGNLFNQQLTFSGGTNTNILNTPYFHKQLFTEYNTTTSYGKYKGSAYLLLNSLSFADLEDDITATLSDNKTKVSIPMSSLFREVSASHYIPYHLILKWGSLYHRYKNYILNGADIISGITTPLNTNLYFSNNSGTTFTVSGTTVSSTDNLGIHPYYDSIFHQIVNGYNFYDVTLGNSSFSGTTTNGSLNLYKTPKSGKSYWASYTDNSKLTINRDKWYTLLPSDGGNSPDNIGYFNDVSKDGQNNYRIIWSDDKVTDVFSGKTFFTPYEYNLSYVSGTTRTNDKTYNIDSTHRKLIDLIATFSPDILNEFENTFLDFASEKENVEIPYVKYTNVKYTNFQDLLKEIVTIPKSTNDSTDASMLIQNLKTFQLSKLINISEDFLNDNNKLKLTLGNPKELDLYVLEGFSQFSGNTLNYGQYNSSQLSSNQKYITLYIGEDIDGNYLRFFTTNNVELSEENVLTFRPLIKIFAGAYKSNPSNVNTNKLFIDYLMNNILLSDNGAITRFSYFLNRLTSNFTEKNLRNTDNDKQKMSIFRGFNDDDSLKLEMYSHQKSFNDKWVGGNSLGQRLLFEEFLFLDKANKDIGDVAYLDITKLIGLDSPKDDSINLYSTLSTIIKDSNFDVRALPSYVNFYGTNFSNKSKLTSSKTVAKNMFGTFLEVDYQESAPKIILQYFGPTSKILDVNDINKKMMFKDDSGNLFDSPQSPLIVNMPSVTNSSDYMKSNKVVSFEVNIGDQSQGMFKGIQLDQTSIKNTTMSAQVTENLSRSEGGAATYNIDIGLFDIYRQASYTCEVVCMGNVMIQPTMYFYLKNIPLFKGSYWITEVTHNIRNNNITTSFKGVRIPYASLPDPKESFLSSYRPLFDKINASANVKVKTENTIMAASTADTEINKQSFTNSKGQSVTVDMGPKDYEISGEKLTSDSGIIFSVPYNGYENYQYVQQVTYDGKKYLRARVLLMGGKNYPMTDTTLEMNVINHLKSSDVPGSVINKKVKWGDIKSLSSTEKFFAIRYHSGDKASDIVKGTVEFYNPNSSKRVTVTPSYNTTTMDVQGPVFSGPNVSGYGMAMSYALFSELGLKKDGDVVYFNIS